MPSPSITAWALHWAISTSPADVSPSDPVAPSADPASVADPATVADPASAATPTPSSVPATAAPARTRLEALRAGRVHLELRAQTDFPIAVGARVAAELPYRLQISTALGGLPGGYVDVINAVVVAAGGYDDATAEVIRGALSSSLVWRTHVGWRPLRRRGFYFEAGYGLVTLGGGLTAQDVLVVATGSEPLPSPPGARAPLDYDVRSTLHMIDAEVGWRWLVWHDRIVLTAALGFAGTVAARTRIDPADPSRLSESAPLEALAAEGEAYLDGIYTEYVMTPVASVGVGWRFF